VHSFWLHHYSVLFLFVDTMARSRSLQCLLGVMLALLISGISAKSMEPVRVLPSWQLDKRDVSPLELQDAETFLWEVEGTATNKVDFAMTNDPKMAL
jgi:hypothetical protein